MDNKITLCEQCLHLNVCADRDCVEYDDEKSLTYCNDFDSRFEHAKIKHGRWIDDRTNIVCSECGAEYSDEIVFMNRDFEHNDLPYCPNCGARMDGDANDEG